MAANFSSVPVLDFALVSDNTTKPEFILQLRHALINVGFLYLSNHTVSQKVTNDLIDYIPRLFDLPQEAKNQIFMANSPHFLGYSKLGAEFTKGKTDYREQFDFATPHETQWKPGAPEHLRLWGPSQVKISVFNHFQAAQTELISPSGQMRTLSQGLKTPWRYISSRFRP
jgi:isopenicillin N synthase-like dioxygenase